MADFTVFLFVFLFLTVCPFVSFPPYRVYKGQNRPDEALNQCEKSLQLLKDGDKPDKTCFVYRDMAAIEQDKGHMDQTIEHLSKATQLYQTLKCNIYKQGLLTMGQVAMFCNISARLIC